jgi:hypothetical protein
MIANARLPQLRYYRYASVQLVEASMFGSEVNSPRKPVHIEDQNFRGWGCSECAWRFNPSGPPVGKTLDEMARNFEMQLSKQFASHACARAARQQA